MSPSYLDEKTILKLNYRLALLATDIKPNILTPASESLSGANNQNTLRELRFLRKTAANMGFSAMLAGEYILIVLFAYRLHHGATCLRNIS
jgi:hypothetical protein